MQQIADGLQTAGFGVDLNIFMWLLLDEGFRKMQDVFTPYEDWEKVGQSVSRVITPANAEDYLEGFVAYPGMEDDFVALWSGKHGTAPAVRRGVAHAAASPRRYLAESM